MTDASDKCEGPYCSDMTITMQGGLYVTLAYSRQRGNTLSAPAGGLCEESVHKANILNSNEFDRQLDSLKAKLEVGKTLRHAACEEESKTPAGKTGAGASQKRCLGHPGGAFASLWEKIITTTVDDETFGLYGQFSEATTPSRLPLKGRRLASSGAEAKAKTADNRGNDGEGVFAGFAVVYMGETSISSLKHPLKVESTGQSLTVCVGGVL